jgi:pyruvate kinase
MHAERVNHLRAHTKIVATVGPASRSPEQLAALMTAGVDVFRLNMAHGEIAQHEEVLKTIRRLSDERKHPTAVLVDLAGPKIRLGRTDRRGGRLPDRRRVPLHPRDGNARSARPDLHLRQADR